MSGPGTVLYALYNYTFQSGPGFDRGQELNLVIKQPVVDNLSVAVKYGIGHRSGDIDDQTAHDARLFITYTF